MGPVIIDVAGQSLTSADKQLLADPWVGGIILFTRNYRDPDQLQALVADIRSVNNALIVAVDHEGGRVQRFKEGFTQIPAMQKLGAAVRNHRDDGLRAACDIAWLLAAELIACGVDISFAPVIDVDDVVSDIIGDRSFSASAEQVSTIAEAFIEGMHQAGMAATGKHFPGHGGVKADSHLELPVDKRTLAELEARDLIPFCQLAGSLDALMPAHILFSSIDGEPVGFSTWWLKTYLRKTMGYKGVIFSDDLSMEGAVAVGSYSARALKAIEAGCSSVLVCNNREGAVEVIESLKLRYKRPINSGLQAMSAKKKYTPHGLRQMQRWQSTASLITQLNEAE